MSTVASGDTNLEVLVGTTLADRYRLDAMLGSGGMGAVFRAHHLTLKRDEAVKVMRPELINTEMLSERFDREAETVARLDHPNIVRVTDYGSTPQGMKYLAMELLRGQGLETLLGEKLPPSRALELTRQILSGLEHAHAHGVVHRDLKPENVFVTQDHAGREILKILDFGLAKRTATQESMGPAITRAGLAMGTPRYMSPEQVLGGGIDQRSDLYAVGILLYEMLNGAPPFDGDDVLAVVSSHLSEEPPALGDDVPPPLAAIVSRLLAKERDARFATATEVLGALDDLDSGASTPPEPTVDRAVPATARRRPRAKKRRKQLVRPPLVAAAVLAAVLFGWLAWPDGNSGERLQTLTDLAAEIAWRLFPPR